MGGGQDEGLVQDGAGASEGARGGLQSGDPGVEGSVGDVVTVDDVPGAPLGGQVGGGGAWRKNH